MVHIAYFLLILQGACKFIKAEPLTWSSAFIFDMDFYDTNDVNNITEWY